jgi:hypothetical protein
MSGTGIAHLTSGSPRSSSVLAPTLAITVIGGTLVQLLRQRSMRRLAPSRRSLNQT